MTSSRTRNARTSLLEAFISSCSWQKLKNGQTHFLLRAQLREKASFLFQSSYYQDTTKILAVSNLCRLSSVKEGIPSQTCLK